MTRRDLPDLLAQLVDRSLVIPDESTGRYRMIESVRDYARELALESGEATKEMHRFLDHMLDFVAQVKPALTGPDALTAYKQISDELDNLRAAMDWALNNRGTEALALRIAADLGGYWVATGLIYEGRRWLTKTIESNRYPDPRDLAWAMLQQTRLRYMSGDAPPTDEVIDGVIQRMEGIQDTQGMCLALSTKAWGYFTDEGIETGRALMQRAVSAAKEAGHPEWGAAGMIGLGEFARLSGELRVAEQHNLEGVAAMRGYEVAQLAIPLVNLGTIAMELGEIDRSLDYYKEAIAAALPYNDIYVSWAIQGVGMALLRQGDFENGGRLFGYATHVLSEAERVDEEADDRVIKRILAEATASGGDAFQQALNTGRTLNRRQALDVISTA